MKNRMGIKVIKTYGDKCWYCGKELTWEQMQIDHFIPRSKGGNNKIENLRPSCKKCNSQKSTRDLETFRMIKRVKQKNFPPFITSTVVLWLIENHNINLDIPNYDFYFEGIK